jgi:hypothetical protein
LLVQRDNSLPGGRVGRVRTTRWSVLLLSAQIAAGNITGLLMGK